MTERRGSSTAKMQKLLLRVAAAVSAGAPIELLPDETAESINATLVAALGTISRSTRLDAVAVAARPIAERLGGERMEPEILRLVAALNALDAHDAREADHTIRE